jgi:quinol monooxygenase YgiN
LCAAGHQGLILMRVLSSFLLALNLATAVSCASAQAQDSTVFLATYVEVLPNAVGWSTKLLAQYRDASRKDDGNLRFDVLQEIARPNRFAIVETWRDKTALEGHAKAAGTARFRNELKTIQNAPYDERINNGLYVAPAKSESRGAIHVVTHVDVIPPGKDDCLAAFKTMSDDTRNDSGNISYDVLQQTNRPNHFTVLETWVNRKALDAHAEAAHTRAFRARLTPITGALYDERFYKTMP